ncbi:hypothetical protein G6O69_17460 [Pseudenhygromyxa sp. WMMC2535]|uniref:hypothetical protein n=1 Tax=Pseudenhygromyxa sp. WMMC2535 TaxID=2712867 RepID=UPI001553AA73|nr:hypothetical protein [Pseudenhygromyxa sp. WMMC2535]NVB39634.1 hypothetical protein [Pseudenhygromyxa sp. WMMC2535]
MASFWIDKYDINAAMVTFPPFSASPIQYRVGETLSFLSKAQQIAFCETEINYPSNPGLDLMDVNNKLLTLELGSLGPRGLSESHLSTLESTPTWKKIASDLKRRTKAGMKGRHEKNGAEGTYRNFRYTPGAKQLYDEGVSLRQFDQSAIVLSPLPVNK